MIHSLSRENLEHILKKGKRFSEKGVVLIVSNKKRDKKNFSVIVSKKCFRKAVDRNNAKRQIREIVRAAFPLKKDLIILLQKPQSSFLELEKNIKTLLQKI